MLQEPGRVGKQPASSAVDKNGQLSRAQLEALVEEALQTHEPDSEGFLHRVAQRLER